jgi:hypothetical protein
MKRKDIEKDSMMYGEYRHDGIVYIGMDSAYPTNGIPTWEPEGYEVSLWDMPAYNRETLQDVTLTFEALLDKSKLASDPDFWGDPSNWDWDDFDIIAVTEKD